ncbi:MAG: phosphoribosylformylglycinamidine cyclo-ligase [Thermodesulfobacteriota bacterium]|nr:phosphoribosylformylglycinamidine cyclo-ligase [Thermodesulfobacteriota bacterium]
MHSIKKLDYKKAGVDINASNSFVESIKKMASTTLRSETISGIGGFGGLFSLHTYSFSNPVLVASTDGVGTKLKIAFLMNTHNTIGIDLVAMCVNDIVSHGAEPLFFLDYFATGKLISEIGINIIEGIVAGCKEAGCSLLGGETAEMPFFYKEKEYDLSGFAVGIVDRDAIIDGSIITVGDRIIGLASNGIHANGFSLVRKLLFEDLKLNVSSIVPELGQTPIGEILLKPTKIYVKSILNLRRDFNISGIAHITGGGLIENISRILPKGCSAEIRKDSWEIPTIFKFIQEKGNIDEKEMFRTFNLGIGMVIVIKNEDAQEIVDRLKGMNQECFIIGEITKRGNGDQSIRFI